jgi:hypothetical protein
MARGDTITAIVELGGGMCESFVTEATRNGRTIDVYERGKYTYVEERKGGRGDVVRSNRFQTARVVALIDGRQEEPEAASDQLSLDG